jgi:hypothetical protein
VTGPFSSLKNLSTNVMGLALLAALATGCANGVSDDSIVTSTPGDESDALVSDRVVVADSTTTAAAEVLADRIVLPLAVADRYRSLPVASIFAGARGSATGKNPEGFLRKVTSVTAANDTLVIMTTPASLTDAILSGAVRATSGSLLVEDDGSGTQALTSADDHQSLNDIAIDFADKPLFDGTDDVTVGAKNAHFVESIHLERAVLTAQPVVAIDLRIRDGRVSHFVARVEGNLDTSVSATATVTGTGDLDADTFAALRAKKHDITRVIYKSARVALPTVAVGGVPISPSVQLTVTLRCGLAFGGPLVAHAGVEAKSYVRLGAVYDNDVWGAPIRSDFAITPSFTLDQGGDVDARCAIETAAELSAFGDSSVTMSVAPYVDFGVKSAATAAAPSAFHYRVGAGASGAMHGESGAFGISGSDLDRDVTEWTSPKVLEGDSR